MQPAATNLVASGCILGSVDRMNYLYLSVATNRPNIKTYLESFNVEVIIGIEPMQLGFQPNTLPS